MVKKVVIIDQETYNSVMVELQRVKYEIDRIQDVDGLYSYHVGCLDQAIENAIKYIKEDQEDEV